MLTLPEPLTSPAFLGRTFVSVCRKLILQIFSQYFSSLLAFFQLPAVPKFSVDRKNAMKKKSIEWFGKFSHLMF